LALGLEQEKVQPHLALCLEEVRELPRPVFVCYCCERRRRRKDQLLHFLRPQKEKKHLPPLWHRRWGHSEQSPC